MCLSNEYLCENSFSFLLTPFIEAKLLYTYKYLSVRLNLCKHDFQHFKILVNIALTTDHLFFNHLVRLSVGKSFATYGGTQPCLYLFLNQFTKETFIFLIILLFKITIYRSNKEND